MNRGLNLPREFSEHRERWRPPEHRENDENPEMEKHSERIRELVDDAIRELKHEESIERMLKESIEELREKEARADRTRDLVQEAMKELHVLEEDLGHRLEDAREDNHEEFVNDMKSQLERPSLKDAKEEPSEPDHDGETSETTESSQTYIEGGDGTVYVVETGGTSEGRARSENEEVGEVHQEHTQNPEDTMEEEEPHESVKVRNCISHPEHTETDESEETVVPSESTRSQEKTGNGEEVCLEDCREEESKGEFQEKRVLVPSEVEATISPADDETIEEVTQPIEESARENTEENHEESEATLEQGTDEVEETPENNIEVEHEESWEADELEEHDEESIEVPEEIIRKIAELLEELGELEEEEVDESRVIIDAITGERYVDHSLEPRPYFSETEEDREREEEERIRERLRELFARLTEEEREEFKESVRPEIESEKELEELARRWCSRVVSPDFKQNLEHARQYIRNKKRGEVPRLIRELRALEVEQQWMKAVGAVARKKMLKQLTTMMHHSREADSSLLDSKSREKSLLSLQKFIPPTFENFKHALKERPELKTRKDYRKGLRLAEVYYKVKDVLAREDFSHMSQRAMLRDLSMKYNVPPTSLKNWIVRGALPRLIEAIARDELKKSEAISGTQRAAKKRKKRPSMPQTYERFFKLLERHPYLREIEGFEEKLREVREYFRLIDLQKEYPHLSNSELARRVDVNFDTARIWLSGNKPVLIGIVLTNEYMRARFENRFRQEFHTRLVDSSIVYATLKPLKSKNRHTVENIVRHLMLLCRGYWNKERVIVVPLRPYNEIRGPRWLLDISKKIERNRLAIEKKLCAQMGFGIERLCLRLGLVADLLYIWRDEPSPFDYLELFSNELFFFSEEYRTTLIDTAMTHLGLKGNYLLSQLIKQITRYDPRGLSGSGRLIQDLKPHSNLLRGEVLRFILDSQGLTLKDVCHKIEKVGVGEQILNPRFPDETALKILLARLYAMIGSDGSIDNNHRVSYYDIVALRRDKLRTMVQILGGISCRSLYKKDGSECGLAMPNIVGRILAEVGMPVGDKVLQDVRIPQFIMNGPPELQFAYLEELIPQEGWVTIDRKDNIRIGWGRSVVLYDAKKGKRYRFEQKISRELVKFIEKHGIKRVRKYSSGVEEIYFRLSMPLLEKLMSSTNPGDVTKAKELEQIVRENPSLYIEDERHLCGINGIMTSEQSPGEIRRSISSDRVSVKWAVRASSEDDVALWGILAAPNDERKRGRLEGWMKRHASKVKAAQKMLDYSTQETMRLRNEAAFELDSESMNKEKESGV